MNNKCIIVQMLFLLLPAVLSAKTTVVIRDQKGFDNIQGEVLSCVKAGEKEIFVRIARGTYVIKEKHLTFNMVDAPEVKLHIVGRGTVLVPEGREYHNGDRYVGTFDVNNSWMSGEKDVETWSHIRYAEGQIEVLDEEGKRCRIKSKKIFPAKTDCNNAYILIPHWFQSSVYKIDKIEGQYIFFTADDLKESSYGGYNVNDDYNCGKKDIRYKLCNVETGEDYFRIIDGKVILPTNVDVAREGVTHRFLTIQNSKFASVEVAGLQIRGNAFAKSNPIIYIKNSECNEIRIHKCDFYGMRGNVISITATPNVRIDHNKFEDCYYYGIVSGNESAITIVEKNDFKTMGKRMNNTFCILCRGTYYHVVDNKFEDFGYGGVGVGVWYKSTQTNPCCGVVENNTFAFSSVYLNDIANFGIMDGGAIYLWTKNDEAIIRYNYIHDFSGVKSNRGIFCDDGAKGFKIYGNVITGIANSYCIDSRRKASIEKTYGTTNINNEIFGNVVDGRIRFQGNEMAGNGCVLGENYFLVQNKQAIPQNIYSNVLITGDDIALDYTGEKRGRVGLSSQSYRLIKETPVWKGLKRFVVRKNN